MKEFFEKNNPIDSVTILMFTTMTYIAGPLQNVVVASAFPAFPRNKWLRPPRNLAGIFFSYLALIIGSVLLTASFYIGHSPSLTSHTYQRLLGQFLLPFLGFFLSFGAYCWCTFIVCCWLTEFIGKQISQLEAKFSFCMNDTLYNREKISFIEGFMGAFICYNCFLIYGKR